MSYFDLRSVYGFGYFILFTLNSFMNFAYVYHLGGKGEIQNYFSVEFIKTILFLNRIFNKYS